MDHAALVEEIGKRLAEINGSMLDLMISIEMRQAVLSAARPACVLGLASGRDVLDACEKTRGEGLGPINDRVD